MARIRNARHDYVGNDGLFGMAHHIAEGTTIRIRHVGIVVAGGHFAVVQHAVTGILLLRGRMCNVYFMRVHDGMHDAGQRWADTIEYNHRDGKRLAQAMSSFRGDYSGCHSETAGKIQPCTHICNTIAFTIFMNVLNIITLFSL
jgi:hypothetical protein